MTTITGLTAARMQAIINATVVSAAIVGNNLVLTLHDGSTINAGNVRGPQGIQGIPGPTSIAVVTSTTRPVGGARFTGLGIYETDTGLFYIWDGANWIYRGGMIVCTSATRPAAPQRFVGMEIYETDTNQKLVWNGIRFDKPWNMPWGIVGYAQIVANVTPIAAQADVPGLSVTFTAVANRRLKITVEADIQSTVATDHLTFVIMKDAAQIRSGNMYAAKASIPSTFPISVFDTPAAGDRTYKLQAARTGTGTVTLIAAGNSPAYIQVEDLGPNGVPA